MAPSSMFRSRSSSLSTSTAMRLARSSQAWHMPSGWFEREAVRPADEGPAAAREKHPQVGVDLGSRADGAAATGAEGTSTSMPLRFCVRAPRISMEVIEYQPRGIVPVPDDGLRI